MKRENFNRVKEVMVAIEQTESTLSRLENAPYAQITVIVRQGDSHSHSIRLPLEPTELDKENPVMKAATAYVDTLKTIYREDVKELLKELKTL